MHMVYVREKSVSATAADLMRTDKWVYDWLKRFDAGGLDGLRDLPKNGRPASVPRTTMNQIIGKASQGRCTPKELQEPVCTETNARLHITSIRRIMRGYGLTPKIPQKAHINRANKRAVQNWQYPFGKRVSRLEEEGFTIVDVDGAFFVHDTVSGRKCWFPRGERIVVPYTGSHQRIMGDRSQEAAWRICWQSRVEDVRRLEKALPGMEKEGRVRQETAGGNCVLCLQVDVRRAPVLAKVKEHGAGSQDQGGRVQQAGRHGGRRGVVQNMQDPCMF